MIPNICSYIKEKESRIIYKSLIIILCVIYFVITTIYRPEWNSIYPYKTVFK